MTVPLHAKHRTLAARLRREDAASQIVEFAVALPLLVVFVVGIFDFSGAFTLKQKLTNAAREGARAAAAGPASDLTNPSTTPPVPASVTDAFWVVDNYLTSEQINDCGLSSVTGTGSRLRWIYSAKANGCPVAGNGVTLTIDRGCVTQSVGATTVNVVGTCVNIKYSYQWRFQSVITLLVPATYQGITDLSASAAALNEN
jgi:Flp pilus assembly protein TadG